MMLMNKRFVQIYGYVGNISGNHRLEVKLQVIGINLYTKDFHITFNIFKDHVKSRCFVTTPFSSRSARDDNIIMPFPLLLFLYSVIFSTAHLMVH